MIVKNLTCINCPLGCVLQVESDEALFGKVTGNGCNRGRTYALKEYINPARVITTTVKLNNGILPVIPVKSAGEIPKPLIAECMRVIRSAEINAPVHIGQKVVENIMGTGVDIVVTRDCQAV